MTVVDKPHASPCIVDACSTATGLSSQMRFLHLHQRIKLGFRTVSNIGQGCCLKLCALREAALLRAHSGNIQGTFREHSVKS
jgi:hypothetical protein